MKNLTFAQLVDIQASLTFANLATQDRNRRRRGGTRRHPLQYSVPTEYTVVNSTPTRAPIGTPIRPPPNTPFSHIRIVPKISPEGSIGTNSPQPIFRKPSLSDEAEAGMNETHDLSNSSSTATIAGNFAGTTFAARARAAELNAHRSRKTIRPVDSDGNPPSSAPVTLGSVMKIMKPRAKNKSWKPLSLEDLPESENEAGDGAVQHMGFNEAVIPGLMEPRRDTATELDLDRFDMRAGPPKLSPASKQLAQLVDDYDASEWDPDMPTGASNDSRPISRASSSHVSSQQISRPTSAITTREVVGMFKIAKPPNSPTMQSLRQIQEHKIAALEAKNKLPSDISASPLQHVDLPQEAKLAKLGVLPAVQNLQHSKNNLAGVMLSSSEDPFEESPSKGYQYSSQDKPYGSLYHGQIPQPFVRTFQPKYPAVKGTMNHNFRFPPSYQMPGNTYTTYHQPYYASPEKPEQYNNAFANAFINQYTPSYLPPPEPEPSISGPYNTLSEDGKKTLLRKNLDELVGAGVPQANLASSTRTVLHDPATHSSAPPNAAAIAPPPGLPTKPEAELLQTSEPMPWRERLVNVLDRSTPTMSNAELAVMSTPPHFQLVPEQPESAQRRSSHPKAIEPAEHSFDEVNNWWNSRSPSQQVLIEYLEKNCALHRNDRRLEEAKARVAAAQRRANRSDDWSDSSDVTTVPEDLGAGDNCRDIMLPIMANLYSYLQPAQYFGRFGRAADWCVDQGHGGQASFFGEDWGAPPPRVGRDPRYRPMLHEGRYTVFDDMGGRASGDGFGRRYR